MAKYEASLGVALPYLEKRGISQDSAERFRLGAAETPIDGHEQFAGRLAIPSLGPRGPYSLRFRCIEGHDCKELGCPKYLGAFGDQTRLFNVRSIQDAIDEICITEGELDTVILTQMGLPSVGVCGASNWKKHHSRMLSGFAVAYVFGDGDKAGREFSKRVCSALLNAVNIPMPEGMDVNDYFLAHGEEGIRELMKK